MNSFTEKQLKNLRDMFEYRKYVLIESHSILTKYEDILLYKTNNNNNNNNIVCIKFVDVDKINVDNIRIFIAFLDKNDIQHGVIVCKNEPSIQVMKEIMTLSITFEIFHANQLNINISKHSLVPKHILLTYEEAEQLKTEFGVGFAQFPKIKYNDAMARYIGAKVGDVIKIEKENVYVHYRYVIR